MKKEQNSQNTVQIKFCDTLNGLNQNCLDKKIKTFYSVYKKNMMSDEFQPFLTFIFLALMFYWPFTVEMHHLILFLGKIITQYTERWKEMKNVSGVMLLTLGLNNVITVHNMPCLRLSCSQLVYVTSQWYESLSVFILWINWSTGTVMCVPCLYSLVLCLYWSHVKVLTSPTGGKH